MLFCSALLSSVLFACLIVCNPILQAIASLLVDRQYAGFSQSQARVVSRLCRLCQHRSRDWCHLQDNAWGAALPTQQESDQLHCPQHSRSVKDRLTAWDLVLRAFGLPWNATATGATACQHTGMALCVLTTDVRCFECIVLTCLASVSACALWARANQLLGCWCLPCENLPRAGFALTMYALCLVHILMCAGNSNGNCAICSLLELPLGTYLAVHAFLVRYSKGSMLYVAGLCCSVLWSAAWRQAGSTQHNSQLRLAWALAAMRTWPYLPDRHIFCGVALACMTKGGMSRSRACAGHMATCRLLQLSCCALGLLLACACECFPRADRRDQL